MNCCPSFLVRHMNIKLVFVSKYFAKFQMSIECCNMKTVTSIMILKGNISYVISKICKYVVTAIFCRTMKCCPSVFVRRMNIKIVIIFKDFAKFQMSIECCNMKTVTFIMILKVNISSHLSKICK